MIPSLRLENRVINDYALCRRWTNWRRRIFPGGVDHLLPQPMQLLHVSPHMEQLELTPLLDCKRPKIRMREHLYLASEFFFTLQHHAVHLDDVFHKTAFCIFRTQPSGADHFGSNHTHRKITQHQYAKRKPTLVQRRSGKFRSALSQDHPASFRRNQKPQRKMLYQIC